MSGRKISKTRRSECPRSMVTPMAVNRVNAGTPRKSAHSSQWRVSSIRVSPTSKQTARTGMGGRSILACCARSCCAGAGLAMPSDPEPTPRRTPRASKGWPVGKPSLGLRHGDALVFSGNIGTRQVSQTLVVLRAGQDLHPRPFSAAIRGFPSSRARALSLARFPSAPRAVGSSARVCSRDAASATSGSAQSPRYTDRSSLAGASR